MYNTHVYAVVRVKAIGTNLPSLPAEIAQTVSDAVCANPTEWLRPSFGTVTTANGERFDIEAVEFADDISGVMIDEIDPGSGRIVTEHLFDWDCKPMTGLSEFRTRREADLAAEVVRLKAEIEALKARGVK